MSAPTPLRLAYISGGFPIWALLVAQHEGLFARHGLQVEVTHTGASHTQMQGLRDGLFDIGLQLPDHPVRASLSGCPMQILAAQTHAPDVALISQPHITRLQDLKGQRIAVDGARSGYALLLRRLLQQEGFTSEDIVLVEVGDSQQRLDALQRGELAASFINPPLDKPLIAQGFQRLSSTRTAFPDYPGPVAAARRAWLDAHADQAQAFQMAWQAAWQWLLDEAQTKQALALATQYLQADAEAAQRALTGLRAQGIPCISETGLRAVVELVTQNEQASQQPQALAHALQWRAPDKGERK